MPIGEIGVRARGDLAVDPGREHFTGAAAVAGESWWAVVGHVAIGRPSVPFGSRRWQNRLVDRLTQLLLDARDGNAYALEAFIAETIGDVRGLGRYLGDADSADDLVQQVYERALRSVGRFRHDGSARSWLLTIARNTCADEIRKRRRRRRWSDNQEMPDIGMTDADTVVVDDLLRGLSRDRREAFVLTQITGCSYAEAAQILDCPIGTVRSRVARAKDDLIALVDDDTGAAEAG